MPVGRRDLFWLRAIDDYLDMVASKIGKQSSWLYFLNYYSCCQIRI